MSPLLRLLALAALLTSALHLIAQSNPQPKPTETRVYKQVGDTKLEIWIYKPAGWKPTDRRSAIVFYHGGGWRGGSPNAFSRQSARLAERGLVAFSVQYRLTAQSGVTIQECVKDARSAFRWVRAHAAELGLDPDKIAAGGGSAGGHLAASLVTLDTINESTDDPKISTAPAALVLFNPALKLSGTRANSAKSAANAEARRAVDPFEHLKHGHPPTIVFHGEDDTTVPISGVRDYAAKVTELGGKCEVVGFPGQVHSFFNREPHVWDTLKQSEAFLEKLALLTPATSASASAPTTSAASVSSDSPSNSARTTTSAATAPTAATAPIKLAKARLLGVRRLSAKPGSDSAKTPPDGLNFAVLVVPTTGAATDPAIKETRDFRVAGESYQEKTRAALGKVFEPETVIHDAKKFLSAAPGLADPKMEIPQGSFVLAIAIGGTALPAGAPVELSVHTGFKKQADTFVLRTKVPPSR